MTGRIVDSLPGLGMLPVAASALRGGSLPRSWGQFPPGRTVLTHQGRGAAGLACGALAIGEGAEVLMPAYNCGTEVDAIRSSGASVVLYRVDDRARADLEDIARGIGPATRAIYVIHYFGWPQATDAVRALCAKHGLAIIEDCALGLFSADGSAPLGRDADAAIYSFAKSLPVPDGGALVLRSQVDKAGTPAVAAFLTAPEPARILRRTMSVLRRGLRLRAAHVRRPGAAGTDDAPAGAASPRAAARPDMPRSYYWDPIAGRWTASRTTLGILARTDPAAVAAARRRNYTRLLATIADLPGLAPLLGPLPDGVCPLALPVLVAGRDEWVAGLRTRGVDATAWWSGHHRALHWDDYPDACLLKHRVLALPIHQGLDDPAIDAVAAALRSVATTR